MPSSSFQLLKLFPSINKYKGNNFFINIENKKRKKKKSKMKNSKPKRLQLNYR